MPEVRYKLRELVDDKPFTIKGTGLTRAAAVAEANAKLAMTVGTVESSSVSDLLVGGEIGTANADDQFSDANLVLRNAGGKVVNVRLENISTSLGTGVNGLVDLEDPLIVAFAAAYRDGAGLGGYTAFDGRYISSSH